MKISHLLILLFLVSCSNSSEIKGHWHLKPENDNFGSKYQTLDFVSKKDSLVYSEKYTFNPYTIEHNFKEKYLIFGGCGGAFTYNKSLNGKELFLKNTQGYGDRIATKHKLTNSHILEDYKKDFLVNVNFPKITKQDIKTNELNSEEFIENIIIGHPNFSSNVFFKDKHRIQVENSFIELQELNEFIDYVNSRYKDEDIELIKFRIISDKYVSNKLIKNIIETLNKDNHKNVFLTCIKKDTSKLGSLFEYIDLSKFQLDADKRLKDALE